MLEKEFYQKINCYYLITKKAYAKACGKEISAIDSRFARKRKIPLMEAIQIGKNLGFKAELIKDWFTLVQESISIDYYFSDNFKLEKSPTFKCYYMDAELFNNYKDKFNNNCTSSDLKVITAIDDKLDGGLLWVRKGDVVLIDTSYNEVVDPAYYVYDCNDETYISAATIQKTMDNKLEFS